MDFYGITARFTDMNGDCRLLAADGVLSPILVFPGEELEAGGLRFTFRYPYYPVFLIKEMSPTVNALLIAAFALLVLALALTFFCTPVLVKVDGEGCAAAGPRPEYMRMLLSAWLAAERGEDET